MISTHTSSDSAPSRLAGGWKTAECSSIEELGWLILASTWSPIVWKDGYRKQQNFLHADFLALDFDDPEFPLTHAQRAFAGLTHIIGTTRNHQREKGGVTGDRYRVVIPFAHRVSDVAVYRYNVKRALTLYDHADQSCKDGARPFFACRSIVEIESDGEPWPVETPPAASKQNCLAGQPESDSMRDSTKRWLRKWLVEQIIPKGERQQRFFDIACAMSRAHYAHGEALALVLASPTMTKDVVRDCEDWHRYIKAVENGYKTEPYSKK